MRKATLIAAALLAGLLAPAADGFHQLSNQTVTITEGFETVGGWTTTATAGTPAGNAWHHVTVDGDKAWYASKLTAGQPDGYVNDVEVTLTSPWFDLRSAQIGTATDSVTFQARGSSEEDADVLTVFAQEEFGPRVELATLSGTDRDGEFSKVDLTTAIGFVRDSRFRLEFVFASDDLCDSEPPQGPDPTVPTLGDDDFLDCDGIGPFEGWYIDDLVIKYTPFVLQDRQNLIVEDFVSIPDWTIDADNGDSWHVVNVGAPHGSVAYTARLAAGQPDGYANGVQTILATPVLDTTGFRVRSVQFDVRGSSETDADILRVEWNIGNQGWAEVASFSGEQAAWRTFDLQDEQGFALLQNHPFDRSFQVRFRFVSDGACDSTAVGEGEDLPPPAGCGGLGPFDGWFIDNVIIDAWPLPVDVPVGATILPFTHPATPQDINTVDLQNDRTSFIGFRVDETALAPSQPFTAGRVLITHEGGFVLERALQRNEEAGQIDWFHGLAVSDGALLLGQHTVRFQMFTASGPLTATTARSLSVTGVDDGAPTLTAAEPSPQIINAIKAVRVHPQDALLARVTYQLPTMTAPQTLPSPYILGPDAFVEGSQVVVFTASDRSGNTATLAHTVIKDTTPPDVTVNPPDRAFQDLPATIDVDVEDTTPVTIILQFNGSAQQQTLSAGGGTASFAITFDGVGAKSFTVTVRDSAGNRIIETGELDFEEVFTDIALEDVQVAGGPFLPGDAVQITANVIQLDGVADIPATLTVTSEDGAVASFEGTVPLDGERAITHVTSELAPGRQTIDLVVTTPPSITELDATNQARSVDVEVFAGRVDHDGQSYHIRVSELFGLPFEAVDLTSGDTYRLTAPDPGSGRYVFDVDGEELYWDPLSPITTIEHEDGEDSPGVGMLALVVLLGVAAVVLRRRE